MMAEFQENASIYDNRNLYFQGSVFLPFSILNNLNGQALRHGYVAEQSGLPVKALLYSSQPGLEMWTVVYKLTATLAVEVQPENSPVERLQEEARCTIVTA